MQMTNRWKASRWGSSQCLMMMTTQSLILPLCWRKPLSWKTSQTPQLHLRIFLACFIASTWSSQKTSGIPLKLSSTFHGNVHQLLTACPELQDQAVKPVIHFPWGRFILSCLFIYVWIFCKSSHRPPYSFYVVPLFWLKTNLLFVAVI